MVLIGEGEAGDDARSGMRGVSDCFADWLARNDAVAIIVRPDRYVYGAASGPQALPG
ncbi:hypothetical protein [Sphingopyxis sp. GC21]|uniref:hypothetical protein n=1 Tax=Sphingopyxis sp. GC21 TaxID=2933562 RepID=UPI0021E5145D|nr:hypothetical protein [Sphingopyxis sp. GC21]